MSQHNGFLIICARKYLKDTQALSIHSAHHSLSLSPLSLSTLPKQSFNAPRDRLPFKAFRGEFIDFWHKLTRLREGGVNSELKCVWASVCIYVCSVPVCLYVYVCVFVYLSQSN